MSEDSNKIFDWLRIISRVVSSRKDLDEVHTLRSYSRPISFHHNLNQIEQFNAFNNYQNALNFHGSNVDRPFKNFTFFKRPTKRPCKVILKAPFHYKTGKHRLTLFQRNLTLLYHYENSFTKNTSPISKIINIVEELTVNALPIVSGTTPAKSSILEVSAPVSIYELLFKTAP